MGQKEEVVGRQDTREIFNSYSNARRQNIVPIVRLCNPDVNNQT